MTAASRTALILALAGAFVARQAAAQSNGWGRVSLFGTWSRDSQPGSPDTNFSEVTASATLRSPSADAGGFEYGFDIRGSAYPSTEGRSTRSSIYDAYVGGRLPGGALGLRLGQMWLSELGGLGSFAGALLSYRQPGEAPANRLRAGIFGGLEPKILDVGYEKDIRKFGGYVALDGTGSRSHVLGYITIRDAGMTERSVLTMTNFIPIGKTFFLYQAAEYDVQKPGGLAKAGLNYLFANVRYSPIPLLEIQGLYHHGRSIDARTLSQDQLNGRPVDSRTVEGFLFESAGGRVTVRVLPSLRIYAGYSRERDNQNDRPYGKTTLGLFCSDVFHSGLDLTVSDNRSNRTGGSYDSWYASLGHNLGTKVYISADYSTSLSVLDIVSGGVTVETRPKTRRFGLSGNANLGRHFSLLLTGEELRQDSSTDRRVLIGLVYRF